MEHFESVRTMIDHLRSEDPEMRLNSMRGIHVIASTLGPKRTRDELLLYLVDFLDDNDEVLRVFANALGTMLNEVGGMEFANSLLIPLETLCGLDEVTVRDEAVASLRHIAERIFKERNPNAVTAQGDFLSLLDRLQTASPQSRSCACYLTGTVYTTGSKETEMLNAFEKMAGDGEIMVRRAACVALGTTFASFVKSKDSARLTSALMKFASDSSDGIRLQAMSSGVALLAALPKTLHSATLLNAIAGLARDNSWRVRYMSADCLGKFAAALSPQDVAKHCVPIFLSLCKDADAEIRASAVFNMDQLLANCPDTKSKQDVLIAGSGLSADDNCFVRSSLASSLLKSVSHVPSDMWGSVVVPTCTTLLRDADADVRLGLVSGFSSMGKTTEAKELAPKLIPVIVSLAADTKWRVRETVVAQVPFVITALGRGGETEVLNLCVEHLTDRVSTIRDAALQSCSRLVAENGSEWATRTLLPRVKELAANKNYLYRISLCHLLAALADVNELDPRACHSSIWPILRQLAGDAVPNVRINVAKAIWAHRQVGKLSEKDTEPVLTQLQRDADADVREAATTPPPPKTSQSKEERK